MTCDALKKQHMAPEQFFRAGVIAILWNPKTRMVLVGERIQEPTGTLQFPQGGIEAGQDPLMAVVTEVQEETGIVVPTSRLLMELPNVYAYAFKRPTEKHGWGQVHRVFVFEYTGPAQLHNPSDPEFSELRWMPFEDVLSKTAPFRTTQYCDIYADFLELGPE